MIFLSSPLFWALVIWLLGIILGAWAHSEPGPQRVLTGLHISSARDVVQRGPWLTAEEIRDQARNVEPVVPDGSDPEIEFELYDRAS